MFVKILVAYYSQFGDTRKVAKLIRQKTSGKLFEIEPETPYHGEYDDIMERAKKEIEAGSHPALKTLPESFEPYDTFFIGTPNWLSKVAPPVATFLSSCDLSGKTIIPFYTHGGGGAGEIEKDIAELCPGATVKPGFARTGNFGSGTEALVEAWLRDTGIIG